MGRWSYICIKGTKEDTKILFITGYRTGIRTGNAGVKTAWSQQNTMLIKEGKKLPPHDAFLQDMETWICQFRTDNMEIVLCMDANEQWTEGADIVKFARSMQLKNVNRELGLQATHPNISNIQRSTTIDYCLCSEKVLSYVSYATSTPYDLEVLGDHRGFIIDINMDELLREETTVDEIRSRKLVLSDPKSVEKYIKAVEKKIQKQNIFHRSMKLIQKVNKGGYNEQWVMLQYNKLDREIHGICTKAEKECRPDWAGKYEWSPDLAKAIKTINYWRHRLREANETSTIKNKGQELGILFTPLSKGTIHQLLNDSKKKLREVQQKSRTYRQKHLEELATQYATQNNMTTQRAVLELLAHEESRGMFRQLRQQIKNTDRRQIRAVWEAMDEDGNHNKDENRRIVYDQGSEIHRALLRRNSEHLNQAVGTPFASGKLYKGLKWDGTGEMSRKILNGEILNEYRFNAEM